MKTELTDDQKRVLDSFCTTDEEVKNVVDIIRKDIIPVIQGKINVSGEKIVVRKIFIKEAETSTSGIIAVPGQKQNKTVTKFFGTHPFQGVIVGVGEDLKSEVLKTGKHIILKHNFQSEDLSVDTVILEGMVFGCAYVTDVICSVD